MEYTKAAISVDPVIFTIHENKLKVLLQQREKEPYKSQYELPGGLMRGDETAEACLKRKLSEVLGKQAHFEQFSTFTQPDRDPRERTISIGFIALIHHADVRDLQHWQEYTGLPKLAFDHKHIITTARIFMKENPHISIIRHFLPEHFPLNALQSVYEVIEEKTYDNRNFRKKMIDAGIVEETTEREQNVSHRPAVLYRFVD